MGLKKITPLNLEVELVERAKREGVNMSAVANDAIEKKLGIIKVQDGSRCHYCGREEVKASVDIKGEFHDGITWLCPDEKWICTSCLRRKTMNLVRMN